MTELLLIKNIDAPNSLQPRAKMDMAIIDEYTESLKAGASFPAITVFKVGSKFLLVDGYHRLQALQDAGHDKVLADVREGTARDATLFSVGVNATHGLRRTNEDKHRAVMVMLKDKEWSQWSDVNVAAQCNVSSELVAKIRKSILPKSASRSPEKVKVLRKGKSIKMDTTNIGKNQKPAEKPPTVTAPPVTPKETEMKKQHTEQHPAVTHSQTVPVKPADPKQARAELLKRMNTHAGEFMEDLKEYSLHKYNLVEGYLTTHREMDVSGFVIAALDQYLAKEKK